MDAFDPDLTGFRNRGGRLLLYHGFNDPSISPLNTINYYDQVVATVARKSGAKDARARTAEFARLFLVPGMNHCGGGPGTSNFDMVTELEHWVERKQPPASILASHLTDGKVDRTRPLCPYPQSATYKGSGNTDDAANFVCSDPK
jgi:feruloyl esterase